MFITTIACTKKPLPQTEQTTNEANKFPYAMYIGVQKGLNLRSGPDIKSQVILVIPYREKVLVTKEAEQNVVIDNVTGKWVNVKWRDKTGWLFSGYLNKILFMVYDIIPYDSSKLLEIVNKNYPNKNIMEKSIYEADITMFNEEPLIKPDDEVIIINKQGVFEDTIKKIYFSYIFLGRNLLLQFDIAKESLCNNKRINNQNNQCVYIKKNNLIKYQNNLPSINNLDVIQNIEQKNKLIEKVFNKILNHSQIISSLGFEFNELRDNPQNKINLLKEIIINNFQLTVKIFNNNLYLLEFKCKKNTDMAKYLILNAVILEDKVVFLEFSQFINSFKIAGKNYFFFSTWIPGSGANGNVLYYIKDNKWINETSDYTFAN